MPDSVPASRNKSGTGSGRGDKTKRTVTGSFTFVQDDDKANAGVTVKEV